MTRYLIPMLFPVCAASGGKMDAGAGDIAFRWRQHRPRTLNVLRMVSGVSY